MVPSHFELLLQGCLQEYQSPQSLGIVCQDGKLFVNILVLNFICPTWLNSILSMDSILILPSVKIQDLDIFFTCLQTATLPKHLLSQLECSVSNLSPFFNLNELFQDNMAHFQNEDVHYELKRGRKSFLAGQCTVSFNRLKKNFQIFLNGGTPKGTRSEGKSTKIVNFSL